MFYHSRLKYVFALIMILVLTRSVSSQITTADKLNKLIGNYARQGRFNGSALVAIHGKILLDKGYGYKSFKDKTENNPNTIFQIASVTKQFTSAVILKLVELNELSLDDKLSKWYPNLPESDNIKIENLLTHTSGIHDWTNNSVNFSPASEPELVKFLEGVKTDFPAGTRWSYSNSNYSLLGYIIQKITGTTYENSVRKFIFVPLQMTKSGFDFKHLTSEDKATGYSTFAESPKIEAPLYDSTGPFAAGEIYSTVEDLYKWHQGLQENKVITSRSLEKAYTPYKNNYGFGWQIDSLFGKRVTSHSGSISGFTSNLARIEEDSAVVILLNNKEGSGLEMVTRKILAVLYDSAQPVQSPPDPHLPGTHSLKKYTGTYLLSSMHGEVTGKVTIEKGRLYFREQGRHRMLLISDHENFFYDLTGGTRGEVQFKTDSRGKVGKIVFWQEGVPVYGKKIK